MKYEAVLFDMDGTVLDTVEDLRDSANVILQRYGFAPIDSAKAQANLGNGSRYYLKHSAPEGTDDKTLDKMLEEYLPYYDTHSLIKTRPFPLIPQLISRLDAAGIRSAIISNKPDSTVKGLAQRFFPGIYALGEISGVPRKPRPEMVWNTVKLLGADINKCVYVGDTEVDIMTGKNSGMDVIAVSWGFRSEEQLKAAGAERIAHSEEELYNMIMD